jgi:hypothetical protein
MIGYCYHSVNVISLSIHQSESIKLLISSSNGYYDLSLLM